MRHGLHRKKNEPIYRMIQHTIKIFLIIICLAFSEMGFAQTAASARKVKKDAMELLVKAKEQMAVEDYHAANKSFREMLELNTALPTEMCYFFANTLYQLKQFDNSLRFVEKYESLAGAGGDYYQENLQLKKLLKEEMETVRECNYCDSQGYVLEECSYCNGEGTSRQSCKKCLGHKEIKCKNCSGEGVAIGKNHFGQNTYQTCQVCGGNGIQPCAHCDGKGFEDQNCQHCSGKGKIRTTQLCTHPPHAN